MMVYALLLFAFAAIGGVLLVALRLRRGANPPMGLALVHGLAAASGLVVLLASTAQTGFSGLPAWSAGLFVVAAIGGFVLFASHLRDRLLAVPLVAVHAGVAVLAFLLLAVAWSAGA